MPTFFPAAHKFLALISVILLSLAMLMAANVRVNANEDEDNGGVGIGISIDVMKLLKKKKKQATVPAPAPAKKKTVAKPKDTSVASKKPIGGVPPKGETRYRRDEVLFVLKPTSPADALANVVRAQNLSRIAEAPLQLLRRTVHRYAITDNRSLSQVIAALEADPTVESAQPNYQYELIESSTSAPGTQLQYANVKLHVAEAHKSVTGKDVIVALIDSRVDASHEALELSIKNSYSSIDYPSTEADAHGTAMAGAIAGHGQTVGTAPQSRLLAVECFSKDKEGHMEGVTFNILKGVDWAHSRAALIINMSFAGPRDPLLSRLMRAAAKNGVILVAAAGNAGAKSPPLYPGADENALAVTATDSRDRVFKLANRGKYIAVAAPGVDVIVLAPGNSTAMSSGTSVAAAHISGLAALAMERAIKIDAVAFRRILKESASKLQAPPNSVGAGQANALKLVEKAAELDPNHIAQQ
jgi:subtilisin family serine protease